MANVLFSYIIGCVCVCFFYYLNDFKYGVDTIASDPHSFNFTYPNGLQTVVCHWCSEKQWNTVIRKPNADKRTVCDSSFLSFCTISSTISQIIKEAVIWKRVCTIHILPLLSFDSSAFFSSFAVSSGSDPPAVPWSPSSLSLDL